MLRLVSEVLRQQRVLSSNVASSATVVFNAGKGIRGMFGAESVVMMLQRRDSAIAGLNVFGGDALLWRYRFGAATVAGVVDELRGQGLLEELCNSYVEESFETGVTIESCD